MAFHIDENMIAPNRALITRNKVKDDLLSSNPLKNKPGMMHYISHDKTLWLSIEPYKTNINGLEQTKTLYEVITDKKLAENLDSYASKSYVIEKIEEASLIDKDIDLSAYALKTETDSKVDKIAGKGLSTNDFTTAYKTKLDGLYNYTLPTALAASIITEDSNHRFSTDAEKVLWNSKANTNHTHTIEQMTNFPKLNKIAITGNYEDLLNKPTIDVNKSYVDQKLEIINSTLLTKANKDGTIQIGLNSEKVGGKIISELALKSDFDAYKDSTNASLETNAKKIETQNFKSSINKFGIKSKPFLQFKKALLTNKNVNITYFGHSLSTGGDKLNINSSNPTGTEYSPNGIVNGEGWTHLVTNEIAKNFPQNKFNFYNRAIGGTVLDEWEVDKNINGNIKKWIEHINDTQPDLLFIDFGMNHNSDALSTTFARNIDKMCKYINANFAKLPDIVFVTSPTCVYIEGNDTWSSETEQETRRNTAKTARYFGLQYADYILDVSRFSDIARFGKDLENIYFEEKNDFAKIGNISLNINNSSLIINEKCRDFSIIFDLATTNIVNGEYLTINFNTKHSAWLLRNTIAIYPNEDGNGKIKCYGHLNDASYFQNFEMATTSIYSFNGIQANLKLRIEKKGRLLKIFTIAENTVETLLVYDNNFDIYNALGSIEFIKSGGNSSTISINNLRYFEAKYLKYQKSITEENLWGKFIQGDTTTKAITGGNGVNHPSSNGIAQVYGIPIFEMIKDIISISKSNSEVDLDIEIQDISFTVDATSFPGFCFGTVSNVLFLQGYIYNDDKSIKLKRNKRVTDFSLKTLLNDGEYGIYKTAGIVQVVFKNTIGANGYAFPSKFSTYQFKSV